MMPLRANLNAAETASRLLSRQQFCRTSSILRPSFHFSAVRQNGNRVGFGTWQAVPSFLRRTLTTKSKPEQESISKVVSQAEKSEVASSPFQQMIKKFLAAKEMPPRWTFSWYREMVLLCTVFAITGSSTMVLVSEDCSIRTIQTFHAYSQKQFSGY